MKKIFYSITFLFFFFCTGQAQTTQTMNYQGIARNNSGAPLANTTIKIRLSIKNALSGGTILYREVKSVQTNAFGLYQVVINDGTGTITGNFNTIDWAPGNRYLQTEIDPANGNSFTNAGTTSLHTVPYAIHTRQAEKWAEKKPVVQSGSTTDPALPFIGTGYKLIWHPKKGAFRVGFSYNNNWEDSCMGEYSLATGFATKAKGYGSVAFGNNTTALGSSSFSSGRLTLASGDNATAMGYMAKATNDHSIAMGYKAEAIGFGSIALGHGVISKRQLGLAVGQYNDTTDGADSKRVFQIGVGWVNLSNNTGQRMNAMTVLSNGNIGIGPTVLNPEYILDVGGRMRLRHNGSSSAGLWLNNSINKPLGFFGARDNFRMGFYFSSTSNWKFLVNQYGDTWIAGKLTQSSDGRLKKDIQPVTGSLTKLKALNGYQYHWKGSERSQSLQTGLIAQEVEKVFPELVDKDEKGYLTVDYSGLIPHLLEAIKTQQEQIEILQKEIQQLKNK